MQLRQQAANDLAATRSGALMDLAVSALGCTDAPDVN